LVLWILLHQGDENMRQILIGLLAVASLVWMTGCGSERLAGSDPSGSHGPVEPESGTPVETALAGTVTISASIAGSAADADGDGLGDNHSDQLPATPALVSAGVDASGGGGSNGTKRPHIEWDITSLSGPVAEAEVLLHTSHGSVDRLDTYFFAVQTDGNGTLEDSDFESPAAQIPGVVMPAAGDPGDQGTFSFDVTDYLNDAIASGYDFFSVQGRVDENLAGGGFKRGLQIRTTCNCNEFAKHPKLIITLVTEITIDIKPGSDTNPVNCRNGHGVIPVAILSTDTFDATAVDHTTVCFEGAGETHINKKTGEPRRHEEDVDGDGDLDLMFHFRQEDTKLDCNSTAGTLTGQTFDGLAVTGTDTIRMIQGGDGPEPKGTDQPR
jgi:hypothetical protein